MSRLGLVIICSLLMGLLFGGCSNLRPQKGGTIGSKFGREYTELNSVQPENPAQSMTQEGTREEKRETPVSTPAVEIREEKRTDGTVITTRTEFSSQIAKESLSTGTKSEVGAAHKDMGREIAAKIAAMRPIQFIGVGLIVFAGAAMFYVPLRIILGGGKQFPLFLAGVGGALIVAPQLIAGNETLILVGSGALGFIYWLTIRLTRKEAEADVKKI